MFEFIKSIKSEATTKQENERLKDALEHIIKTTKQASQQTVRLKWIRYRANAALNNTDWQDFKRPKNKYMPSVLKRSQKQRN
jgi:hypothetical protein